MDGLPVERLRQYLEQLSPAARAMLMAELERAALRGEGMPGGELLLQELRGALRGSAEHPPRIGTAARLFFRPVEPFLIDAASGTGQKYRHRIARAAIEPIWTWIARDLVPGQAQAFEASVTGALAAGDTAQADRLASDFQNAVAGQIEQVLTSAATDDKVRRRLTGQLGAPQLPDDLRDLATILRVRDTLALFGDRLPPQIRNLADAALDAVQSVLDKSPVRENGALPYVLVLLMGRLAAPWQLIRLAVRAAQSDEASRIAATPYAIAVTMVLAEIERMVGELRGDLKRGAGVPAQLKTIHDAVRGVRTELDLPVDQQWGRQLAAIRTEISDVLRGAIESAPGRVRRLLRPRPANEVRPEAVLDAGEVDEGEALIELVGACRIYAGELAVSEVTTRACAELEQILDAGTKVLLDGLRTAGEGDKAFRRSQIDAALRFSAKVFGQEYASLLAKAVEVASHAKAPLRA